MTAPSPALPALEQYPMRIYDSAFNWIGEWKDYQNLTWSRRYRAIGDLSFEVSRYVTDNKGTVTTRDIKKDYWVSIYRGGVARIGRIEEFGISLDGETWTVAGTDGKGIFKDRIAIPYTGTGTGYDTVTSVAAETACLHYITNNYIAALDENGSSDPNRNVSYLQLETDGAKGGSVSYSARLEEHINEIIEYLLKVSPNQLGYEVLFDRTNKKLKPHFFIGVDRTTGTGKVTFSTDFKNVNKNLAYYYNSSGLGNVAYVGDSGEGAARTFTKVVSGTEATGLSRREILVDGRNCTSSAELTLAGTDALSEASIEESMSVSIMLDNSFHYMSRDAAGDFDLGDIITVIYAGVSTMTGRIMEIIEGYGEAEANQSITLTIGGLYGDDQAKFADFMKKQAQKSRIRSRT